MEMPHTPLLVIMGMGRYHLENNQIASGPPINPEPKCENNALKEAVGVNTKTQLFDEMEAVNTNNDDDVTTYR